MGAGLGSSQPHCKGEQQDDDYQQEEDDGVPGADIFCVWPALIISQRA